MSENDNTESVAPEGDVAPAVEASAPAESTDTIAADSATPDDSAGGPSTEPTGDWNGELENIQSSSWFNDLGSGAKQTLLEGLESKYKNWQRGYTDKFQEMSERKKKLESREGALKDSELRVQRWLYGEADPIKDLQEQIKGLRDEKDKVEEGLRAELQKAVEEAQQTGKLDYDKIVEERDTALKQYQEIQGQIQQAEEAALDAEVDSWDKWLREQAPDLYEDYEDDALLQKRDEAFSWFCKLATTGMEKEMALAMLRASFPTIEGPKAPEPEEERRAEPEPVPDSVSLMNMGTGASAGTSQSDPRSFDEIIDAMRRAAQNHI